VSLREETRVPLRFVTPAFLGGATQAAELRTPPFKALLRRWWRVARVRGGDPDHATLREEEGTLLGHAWLKTRASGKEKTWARRSTVRLVIDGWQEGALRAWGTDPKVQHPEVDAGGGRVGAHLYLGYGPLVYSKETRGTVLKRPSAIDAGTTFTLAFQHAPAGAGLRLDEVLDLWRWFGTVGGRCRNGWGSLEVDEGTASGLDPRTLEPYLRPLESCLRADWPHALGRDERGALLWRSQRTFGGWQDAMEELARVKIAFRTAVSVATSSSGVADRHFLASPVTNHSAPWDRSGRARLANQLCFKVLPTAHGKQAVAFHFPHALPGALERPAESRDLQRQLKVWRTVHGVLDREMVRWA
jgi:CRISPR-associated protein Cmr1